MKIVNIKTFLVPPRWLFLKIETDEGLTGWGEPVVEGRARTVKAAVEEMAEYLIGKDPFKIEDHWQTLYRGGFYRGGPVLGITINEDYVTKMAPKGHNWKNPVWRHLDGSIAEW